jgi:hypothetical protein
LIVALLRKLVIQGVKDILTITGRKGFLTRYAPTEYPEANGIQKPEQVSAGLELFFWGWLWHIRA